MTKWTIVVVSRGRRQHKRLYYFPLFDHCGRRRRQLYQCINSAANTPQLDKKTNRRPPLVFYDRPDMFSRAIKRHL